MLGGFVGLAVVIHGYLCLVFFCHGFYLAILLTLVWVPFIETRAVLLLVHTDVGIEGLALLIDHVLQIERAATVQGFTLLLGKLQTAELMGCALLLCLLLAFLESATIVKDELNALLLGIDLKRCIKGLASLGGHTFHFHGFALYEVFVLGIRERYALDFLGDVHSVGTQGDDFIGLWVNGDVGRERFSVLRCYLDGLAQITRSEELLLLFGRELVTHIGVVQLWLFAYGVDCQADVAILVRSESKTGFGIDGGVTNGYGNRHEVTLLPVEQFLQFSALFQSFSGQSEAVEHLPIHLFGVDGGGVLLSRQIVLKGYAHFCQLLLAFGLLTALKHGAKIVHALLHVVR